MVSFKEETPQHAKGTTFFAEENSKWIEGGNKEKSSLSSN